MITLFHTTYDLCIDTEALRDCDDLLGMLRREIDLKTVTHVEHLVHLGPVGTALLVDCPEERRYREEIVLDDADVVAYEMQDLGLSTARAVYHSMNLRTQGVKQLLHHRSVCAGR